MSPLVDPRQLPTRIDPADFRDVAQTRDPGPMMMSKSRFFPCSYPPLQRTMRPPTSCSALHRAAAGPSRATARYTSRQTVIPHRTFFGFFKSKSRPLPPKPEPERKILLTQDNLFHPLAKSPFADLRERAERIRTVSICPVTHEKTGERLRPLYDCEDCGWPTHRSKERWEEGKEDHQEACERLREVNEDDHDLRSGRHMAEFENMPRECGRMSTADSRGAAV